MELLTASAIALATGVTMKVMEKTGENIGEPLYEKTANFFRSLKRQSPDTVTAIEKSPSQPLNYGEVVLEVETAVNNDENLKQALQELVKAVKANKNQKIDAQINQEINKIVDILKKKDNSNTVYQNKIEKLVNFAQGNATININSQTINL